MLDLIKCEFIKIKRKKISLGIIFLSGFLSLVIIVNNKQGMTKDISDYYLKSRFDLSYTIILCYVLVFLTPCLIGLLASMLFFMERDCNTFKSLRVIPITIQKLIFAKVCVLFVYSILFCFGNTVFTILFTKLFNTGKVYDIGYKLGMSIIFGIIIAAASLPLVILIVYFNKSYLVSVMFSFIYSILNWGITGLFGANITVKTAEFFNLFPVICGMNWIAGSMVDHVISEKISLKAFILYPSDEYTICVLSLTFIISLLLIIMFYRKWTR